MHRPKRSPGQRYRFEQYLSDLEKIGYSYDLQFLLNEKEDTVFYAKGHYIKKAIIVLKSYWKRYRQLQSVKQYDLVFIYREALMTGALFFERGLKERNIPFILDFDDAIWEHNTSASNRFFQFLKRPKKVDQLCSWARVVLVGNAYLADYAGQFSTDVRVLPTTIDLAVYSRRKEHLERSEVVIGWTGSSTTIPYFHSISPQLEEIKKKYGSRVRFYVIGDSSYRNEALDVNGIAWNEATEVEDLLHIDIGIMPLPDTVWARGKCGCKGLQYMGLGIPAVMSAVGTNNEIIQHGKNGLLVATEAEWVTVLGPLIESAEARKALGEAGFDRLNSAYSKHVWALFFLQVLQEALEGN